MSPKVLTAITELHRQSHTAEPFEGASKECVRIDGLMLTTYQEMEELAAGVYGLVELEEP
jgi:hypothetical protein